jgi:nitrogen fixation protein FixH
MKINWGTGIVIGMVCFIGFIAVLVYKMTTENNLNHDLVTDEYYQKEMELQDNIYAQQNTANMTVPIKGAKTTDGYLLTFPASYKSEKISGTLELYRPSNKLLDFKVPVEVTNSTLLIPNDKLLEGRWNITMNWKYDDENYRFTEKITYE